MLKRLVRLVGTQRLIPWVGEFKETLAQALFWGTIANFIMIAGTFYYTTLRHILPWFNLGLFIAVACVGLAVILVIEFKFVVPSIWAFRGRQMDLRNQAATEESSQSVIEVAALPTKNFKEVIEIRVPTRFYWDTDGKFDGIEFGGFKSKLQPWEENMIERCLEEIGKATD